MSVASALTDIANSLSTLLSQINAKLTLKGVSSGASDMAEVPDKINAIVTGTGIDTSDATAAAGDIRSGKTAYVDGAKLTGTMNATARSSSDITVSGRTVTVPAGLYASQASKSVASASRATPTISVNMSTGKITASTSQSAGYVTSGSESSEYNASQYGAPLTAENIKSGVTIFGVTGTYGGSGGADSYEYGGATTASRIGAGALVFSLPDFYPSDYSAHPIGGIYMENTSADSGTVEWVMISGRADAGYIAMYKNAGDSQAIMSNDQSRFTFSVTNRSVQVNTVSAQSGGFSSGTYRIIVFYCY